ncbi:MAG: hypothetical protein AAFO69_07705 [Bacteroidota bacterium]
MKKRISSYLLLTFILCYGIFRVSVLKIYAGLVESILGLFNLQKQDFSTLIALLGKQNSSHSYELGWFIYYPSYYLLHICFILVLYHANKKVRNFLIILLTGVIIALVVFILIFRYAEMHEVAKVFVGLFRSLFGLPFILLGLEGGRLLYNDIVTLSKEKDSQ